jgi:hypothetical protein
MNKKQISVFGLASALTLPMMLSGGSSALAATFSNDSLQTALDDITVSGPGIDTVNDQTGYEVFTNTATGNSTATLTFEFSEGATNSNFGIYNVNSPDQKVQLFDGANYSGAGSTVFFADSQIAVSNVQFSPTTGAAVNAGFEFYDYDWNEFGFYLEKADGTSFYTQEALNGGYQQAVVYQGDDETVTDLPGRPQGTFTDNEFIIAFEDEWLGSVSGGDYDDFVVIVESVEPVSVSVPEPGAIISVPEPGAIAGLGVVGASLLVTRRRQKGKR